MEQGNRHMGNPVIDKYRPARTTEPRGWTNLTALGLGLVHLEPEHPSQANSISRCRSAKFGRACLTLTLHRYSPNFCAPPNRNISISVTILNF